MGFIFVGVSVARVALRSCFMVASARSDGVSFCSGGGVKNEREKDYRCRTESIKRLFIVVFNVLGVKNENNKDYGDRTESINAFFIVVFDVPTRFLWFYCRVCGSSFCRVRSSFCEGESSFCPFLPLCQLNKALGGFYLGFWEIGTEW